MNTEGKLITRDLRFAGASAGFAAFAFSPMRNLAA
jgi:hypothetical protein